LRVLGIVLISPPCGIWFRGLEGSVDKVYKVLSAIDLLNQHGAYDVIRSGDVNEKGLMSVRLMEDGW